MAGVEAQIYIRELPESGFRPKTGLRPLIHRHFVQDVQDHKGDDQRYQVSAAVGRVVEVFIAHSEQS